MSKKPEPNIKFRVIALLDRKELEFLEKLGMDAHFSTGKKLTKVAMMSAILEAMMQLNISGEGIKNKAELAEQIIEKCLPSLERRQYQRVDKRLSVGFRKADSVQEYQKGLTMNASIGGFMMEISPEEKFLQVGQTIELTINELADFKNKTTQPIKALGRVVWLKEKEDTQKIEMGVKVIYIHENDQEVMKKYLSLDKERGTNNN